MGIAKELNKLKFEIISEAFFYFQTIDTTSSLLVDSAFKLL